MNVVKFLEFIKKSRNTIALDFDGVIHKNSNSFYDGTIYDEPVPYTKEALETLSKMFEKIIIFTCKSKPIRPKINEKTGTELIWEWLKKYDLDKYIHTVTAEKPIAAFYVDDKGIKFSNWEQTLNDIKNLDKRNK